MRSLLMGTVVLAALLATAPSFAQSGAWHHPWYYDIGVTAFPADVGFVYGVYNTGPWNPYHGPYDSDPAYPQPFGPPVK